MHQGYFFQLSLLKTLLFNVHYFGIMGMKFPVFIAKNVKFGKWGGKLELESLKTGNIRIGFNATDICDTVYQRCFWHIKGTINFGENVRIGAGCKISCGKDAKIFFGKNTTINVNTQIICSQSIVFGEDCMISWEDLIMDSDFHEVKECGKLKEKIKPIEIMDHVWIGSRCSILKGSIVPMGCVIAANSTISKKFDDNNCLIGTSGIMKREISWER